LLRRWDQYVIENQNFCEAFDACKAWQNNFNSQLDQCLGTDGDRDQIGNKLANLQELANMRDDGFRKLQTAADNLQMVLPNTSSSGRDQMRRDMQTLQQSWDNTMSQMNENKGKLENCLSQLSMYDEGSEQLRKWLDEMEQSVKLETDLQATLPEKKSQLERVKVSFSEFKIVGIVSCKNCRFSKIFQTCIDKTSSEIPGISEIPEFN
jgi:nesprin-1